MVKSNSFRLALAIVCIIITINAKAQLSAQFNATTLDGCSPLVVGFHDQSTGNPTQWKWDLGNSTVSFLQNPVVTYFNPGQYTVKLVVQNSSGKDSVIKTKYITVFAQPKVSFSASDTIGCFPLAVQFTNGSTPGTGTTCTYLWDFGDGTSSTLVNPSHIYTSAGVFNVSLKVTDSTGCTKTLTKTNHIKVAEGVKAAFTNSNPVGCSLPETIVFQSQATGPGLLNYQWFFGDAGTAVTSDPTHNYNATGTYNVQFVVTNSSGCKDTSSTIINIAPAYAAFSMPATVCAGMPVSFTNTSSPASVAAMWTFGDGSSSNSINPVKTFVSPGNYTIKLVNDFGSCKDSTSKNVMVIANPVTAFTAGDLISCKAPFTVQFNNASSAGTRYQWDFGDGQTSSIATPSHTYTAEGFFTVSLITINASGCSDTLVRKDYIQIQSPKAIFDNLPQQGCAPFSHTFSATTTSVDTVTGYLWDFGDGTTSTATNPTHIFSEGLYNVQLVITTAGGCRDTIKMDSAIRASVKPKAAFTANPRTVCAFKPVIFMDNSTGTVNEWYWLFGDGGSATSQNPIHEYEDTGHFDIRLVAGNFGCYDTVIVPRYIQVNPPIARFDVVLNCDQPFLRSFTDGSIGADEWYWDFGDGSNSTLQSPTHQYSSTGSYSIALTVKNNQTGCTHTKIVTITVADEKAGFEASLLELCRGNSTIYTAVEKHPGGIVNYTWQFGDGNSGDGNPVNHAYTLAGTYNVSLFITDAAGCQDTLVKSNYIKVNGPTAAFVPSVPGSCLMSSINFNDQSTTDGSHAITQWVWYYGDGISDTLSSPPFSHTYNATGSYNVSLLVTDAIGCSDSITNSNALIISKPVAAFSAGDTISCPSKAVVFTNNSTGPGLTYHWDFGDGDTSTIASPAHIYAVDGIYTVQLNITDKYGCTDQLLKNKYINIVTPTADFTVSDSVGTCPPLVVQFTNTSVNQSSFSWDFGDGNISATENPSHFYNVAGVFTAKLTVTGPGGCTSVKTKTIRVRGPLGSFTYTNFKGCKALTVQFVATSQDRTSFIWDFNDGTTIATDDSLIAHTYTVPGIYVPKLILKDKAGCSVPITGKDTIDVKAVIAGFIADTLLRCTNGSVAFSNTSVSNDLITNYSWDFGDGSNSSLSSPTHFYAGEGIYTVKLKVSTAMGCIDTFAINKPVRVVKTPEISITKPSNGCVPLNLTFAGNLLNADTAAINWSWIFGDGRTANGKFPAPILFAISGTYNVTLTATNSSGCKDTATATIQAYALPLVEAGSDITICKGTGKLLQASGADSYSWSPAAGLSCTNCAAPLANPSLPTKYLVTGTSSQGCKNVDSLLVKVKLPFVMQHSRGDTLCFGESATLTASGAELYNWSPSQGLSSTTAASVKVTPMATTNYRVIGTDSLGCFQDTAYIPLKVYPIPMVDAGPDVNLNVGQTLNLTPTISADVTKVAWNPTGSIFRSTFPSIDIKPNQTTVYTVEVKNEGGCVARDNLTVFVLCNGTNVFIPNTFSPNGDGVNDVFFPRGTGLFTIKTARIFNRWGELVFEKYNLKANEISNGWDGSFRGKKLAPDVFVYVFEIICDNNEVLNYKGDVTLIR